MIICVQTRIENYRENNLPPKLSRCAHNQIPWKSLANVSSSSPQNQTSRFKIAIIRKENIATTSIYLAVHALYNSAKPLGACAQKSQDSCCDCRIQDEQSSSHHDIRTWPTVLTVKYLASQRETLVLASCRLVGWIGNYCRRSIIIKNTKGVERCHAVLGLLA